jgi:ABC-type amino acid transport substrate-binding protein
MCVLEAQLMLSLIKKSCCLLLLSFVCTGTLAESLPIVGDWKAQPKNWLNDDGQAEGIMIDVLNEVSKRTGIEFSYSLSTWNHALNTSKAGQGAIIGFSKNKERQKHWDYSEPMYFDDIVFVARKQDMIVFDGLESLQGKKIAIKRGSSYGDDFEEAIANGIITLVETEDRAGQMRMLNLGRVDLVLLSPGNIALQSILAENEWLRKNQEQFELLSPPYKKDPNYIGVPKSMGKSHLLPKINDALKEMFEDGTYAKIVERRVNDFLERLVEK